MGRDGSIVFLMKVMNIFCKKHIKMENKEQDFINRYKDVQESIVKAIDKRYKYKCIDAYEEPENPMEWLPCPRCGLRPLVWEFDNGRVTAWGCCLLSSGGQSRASNTVTSNSLHASFI